MSAASVASGTTSIRCLDTCAASGRAVDTLSARGGDQGSSAAVMCVAPALAHKRDSVGQFKAAPASPTRSR